MIKSESTTGKQPQRKQSAPFYCVVLLLVGIAGFWFGVMDLSGGRGIRGPVLEGAPALLLSTACVVGAAVIFAGEIEKSNGKKTQRDFRVFRWFGTRVGWALMVSAFAAHLILGIIK